MHSKRIKHTTPQRKKRRALRRVKPRKGTLSFLLGLVALVVLLIIFAPGLELTPENARKFSCLHPRCGTAFLFLVMFISILVGSVADQLIYLLFGIEKLGFFLRFGRSILILPVITGVSYEALKGLAHAGDNILVRALRWPGMMLQHLTTREPDDKMLEVAIAAMKAAKAGSANWKETLGGNVAEYVDEDHEKAADEAAKEDENEENA